MDAPNRTSQSIQIGQIGLTLFLLAEVMFFAGLLSAYLVLRAQAGAWPPPGQPRFPVFLTGLNTLVLLGTAVTVVGAERSAKRAGLGRLSAWLGLTLAGGLLFLSIQGYEWARLIRFGLTTVGNVYGGTFYLVVGAHALHLIAAVIVLFVVTLGAAAGRYTPEDHNAVTLCRTYWIFVVLIWPVIYGLLYF